MPVIEVNMIAVLVAVVAAFVFGFVWYTFLFGKIWAREMGMNPEDPPKKSEMFKGMFFMIIGSFLMAYVMSHDIAVWNPVTWGLEPGESTANDYAIMTAFFLWLGYFLPVDLGNVAWERKSWTLFGINTSYHFVQLLVVAMVLTHM